MKFGFIVLAAVFSVVSFGYEFDKKVPEDVKKQIVDDLAYMAQIAGKEVSPLHQEIFGALRGQAYKEWFEKRVTFIGMHTCGNANAVACVSPLLGSSRIWLTKNYTQFSHPLVAKMMVVYHEARHTETAKGNWSHARCPKPFTDSQGKDHKSIWTGAALAGEPACDKTPYGSYGSSMILLKNISKFCTNCTEKVKMDAGLYADDQFKRVIDKGAIAAIQKDLYRRTTGKTR